MKSKIFILALVLVFTNISNTLAYTFTSNTFDSSIYINTTKYFCNQTTNSCELTNRTDIPTYTKEECSSICIKSYVVNTNLAYTTTTTKLQYISNSNTNYQYIPTTTTKLQYIVNSNYSNYQYIPTNTTKLQYISNTNFSNINYYIPTTTTKLQYILNPITNYQYIPTTTTKPSYILNMSNTGLRYIPTTTTKLQYTISPITNFSNISHYIPTTKPSYTISRSIDLSKAVTVTTLPLLLAGSNIYTSNLMADVMKQDNVEEEIQVLTVGDEEKKENKEKYLIVVVPNMDKDLFKKYIEERKDKFDIKIASLQENGVKNNFQDVLTFIKKTYDEFPYSYLVFHEKIKIGEEIAVWSEEYSETTSTYAPYWNWRDGIYFSRIRTSWLNKNNQGWNKLNFIEPSLFLTHEFSNRYTFGICCDTGLPNYDVLIKSFMSNIKSKFFFENRGTFPITNLKVDFQPLNYDNFLKRFPVSNFVYANSTVEPINVWVQDYEWEYSSYNEPYTLIWTDKDKNGHADNSNSEIAVEKYWTTINDNLKRMTIVMGTENFIDKDYVTFVFDGHTDVNYFLSLINQTVSSINSNISIAKAYRQAYDTYIANLNPEYKHITKILPGTFVIYGPPEATLQDLIEESKVSIQPNTEAKETKIITIPKGKFETDFIIKNIGKVDVTYSFDKNELLDINPSSGIVLVSNETKVNLKILNTINIQSSVNILNNLKPKSTKLYFRSNAGDKEITINYWDI